MHCNWSARTIIIWLVSRLFGRIFGRLMVSDWMVRSLVCMVVVCLVG